MEENKNEIMIGKKPEGRAFANKDDVAEEFELGLQNEGFQDCLRCWGCCTGCINTWICICCEAPYRRIPEATWAVITEFGKYTRTLPSGLHYINPRTEQVILVDRREKILNLAKQSVITKDNVNIQIDAIVFYTIYDPFKATFEVSNLPLSIAEIAKTTLKEVFGNVLLQEAFESRDQMADQIKEIVDKPTENWGVDITEVLIQEIVIPQDLIRGLQSAATAKREAEAKVIQAQADVDSAKMMREASEALNTPAAMQIRYLDAISSLGYSKNTKVVFMPGENKNTSTDIKQIKNFLIQSELI